MQDYFALWVRNKSSAKASDAIFVEVGANDPKVGSNTYSLEIIGWNGLLIEPNPILATRLEKIRTATVKQIACSQIEGTLSIYVPDGASGLAHVVNDSETKMFGQGETIVVRAVRLTDLLEQIGFPPTIDYLSIDVEGHEIDVLNGLDLSRFQFQAVTIEHNYNGAAIAYFDSYFGASGYQRVFSRLSAFDAWYVHPSLVGKLPT